MANRNLTPRERQVLELIGDGRSTKEIAQALGISVWTVGSHRKRICAKLGAHTTAELVALSSGGPPAGPSAAGRPAARMRLIVDFRAKQGRVQLTYTGQLKRKPNIATVRIGRNVFYS